MFVVYAVQFWVTRNNAAILFSCLRDTAWPFFIDEKNTIHV